MRKYLDSVETARIIDFFQDRFGVPTTALKGFRFVQGSRQRIYLIPADLPELDIEVVAGLNICRIGAAIKPTTDFLQRYDKLITKNRLTLNAAEARDFICGVDLTIEQADSRVAELTTGYVCASYDGRALGCGFLREAHVKNLIARDRRRELLYL